MATRVQAAPENLRVTVRSIMHNKPEWADAIVFTFGRRTLTACIDPACFRPVIVWWPAKRSRFNDGYYFSELWEPHTALIEEGDLKWLESRGLRPGWRYLAEVEGGRVVVYGVRERRGAKYTAVAPQERLVEL